MMFFFYIKVTAFDKSPTFHVPFYVEFTNMFVSITVLCRCIHVKLFKISLSIKNGTAIGSLNCSSARLSLSRLFLS